MNLNKRKKKKKKCQIKIDDVKREFLRGLFKSGNTWVNQLERVKERPTTRSVCRAGRRRIEKR